MALTATQEGRNLHLTLDGCEPFVVKPLGGHAGHQITQTYLLGAIQQADALEVTEALVMALDGATQDPATGRWVPVAPEERTNSNRAGAELSLGELDQVTMAAFFWQTILHTEGLQIFLSDAGGVAGHTKAMRALVARLGLSHLMTSPSSVSADEILSLASSRSTSTRQGGGKRGKPLLDRLPKRRRRSR